MVTDIFTHPSPLPPPPPPPLPIPSPSQIHTVKMLPATLYNQILLKQGFERLCPTNNFGQGLKDNHDWFE